VTSALTEDEKMRKNKKYYVIIATLLCVAALISITPLMAVGDEDAAETIDSNNTPTEGAGGFDWESEDENTFTKTDYTTLPAEDAEGNSPDNGGDDLFTRADLVALLTQDADGAVRDNGDEKENTRIDLSALPAESTGGAGWEFDGEKTFIITGDVIIEGEAVNSGGLIIEISGGYTVMWDAYCHEMTETCTDALITVKGSGVFEVAQNGKLERFGSGSVIKAEEDVVVIISGEVTCGYYGIEEDIEIVCIDAADVGIIGGKVSANGGVNRCIAVKASGIVIVADGEVNGGGVVEAKGDVGCAAIMSDGDVTVVSGSIITDGPYGVGILSDNEIQIEASGNSVIVGQGAASNAIEAKHADVTIKDMSSVAVLDMLAFGKGQLWGNAITAGNVTVMDNATVQAINGAAVLYSVELSIDGGALFAYGDDIGGACFDISEDIEEEFELDIMMNVVFKTENLDIEKGAEYNDDSEPSTGVTGNAIAIAWDFAEYWKKRDENNSRYTESVSIYAQDEKTDIIAYPGNGADYGWGPSDMQNIQLWFGYDDYSSFFTVQYDKINMPLKSNPKRDPIEDSVSGGDTEDITDGEPENEPGVESKTTSIGHGNDTGGKTNESAGHAAAGDDPIGMEEVNPPIVMSGADDNAGTVDDAGQDGDPSVPMAESANVAITYVIDGPDTHKDNTVSEKHKAGAKESEPDEPGPSRPGHAEPIAVFATPEAQVPHNSRISQFSTPPDMSLLMLVSAAFGAAVMLGAGIIVLYTSAKRRRKALPEVFRANYYSFGQKNDSLL